MFNHNISNKISDIYIQNANDEAVQKELDQYYIYCLDCGEYRDYVPEPGYVKANNLDEAYWKVYQMEKNKFEVFEHVLESINGPPKLVKLIGLYNESDGDNNIDFIEYLEEEIEEQVSKDEIIKIVKRASVLVVRKMIPSKKSNKKN